ncbi:MAG: TIGR02757 family protein [Polyangiaceae bacterium]
MKSPVERRPGGRAAVSGGPPGWSSTKNSIAAALEKVRLECDVAARLALDPVRFLHRYNNVQDIEVVAFIASSLAFGNVKAFCGKIEVVLAHLGPSPARTGADAATLKKKLARFKHRFVNGGDLAALILGVCTLQREHGTVGAYFEQAVSSARAAGDGEPLLTALIAITHAIREGGGLGKRSTHGAKHVLPHPERGGANKRLLLLLRWMVRPADGVDLGLWRVDPALLVMPVDVHVHRLARNLGFTKRNSADWATAREVTSVLSKLDPSDPVKYDFALCHLGMSGSCPSRRDPELCEGCGVKPVCIHWSGASRRAR